MGYPQANMDCPQSKHGPNDLGPSQRRPDREGGNRVVQEDRVVLDVGDVLQAKAQGPR